MPNSLISEITHCPNVKLCLNQPKFNHPCSRIVHSQIHLLGRTLELKEFQVPEPWSGDLENAPILFLSSNPSISFDEEYPVWRDDDEYIQEYYRHRFGGGRRLWVKDGRYALKADKHNYEYTHDYKYEKKPVKFWSETRQRAIELLGPIVRPGIDYAYTEVVHCKSRSESGVRKARQECADKYLTRIMQQAGARVVVVLGSTIRTVVAQTLVIPLPESNCLLTTIGGKERYIVFLPHPNARSVRSFAAILSKEDLDAVRSFLKMR